LFLEPTLLIHLLIDAEAEFDLQIPSTTYLGKQKPSSIVDLICSAAQRDTPAKGIILSLASVIPPKKESSFN